MGEREHSSLLLNDLRELRRRVYEIEMMSKNILNQRFDLAPQFASKIRALSTHLSHHMRLSAALAQRVVDQDQLCSFLVESLADASLHPLTTDLATTVLTLAHMVKNALQIEQRELLLARNTPCRRARSERRGELT